MPTNTSTHAQSGQQGRTESCANNHMQRLTLESLDKEIKELPALPVIVMDVLAMIDNGDCDVPDIMKKISQDQSLAARVLRVVNSPFYGLSTRIGSLKEAGIMLGVHTLRNIVTTSGIINYFPKGRDGAFDRLHFWQHSIGTGIAAKIMAGHCGLDQEVAFTAGLLHDIGKLVMAVFFTDEYSRVLEYQEQQDCLLKDAEQETMGFDHSLVGLKTVEKWKIPPLIIAAIRYHHTPQMASEKPIAALIHVADIICRSLEIGNGGDTLVPEMDIDVMNQVGIDWNIIRTSLPDIEELNANANLLIE